LGNDEVEFAAALRFRNPNAIVDPLNKFVQTIDKKGR
jgi:hypothetical protein